MNKLFYVLMLVVLNVVSSGCVKSNQKIDDVINHNNQITLSTSTRDKIIYAGLGTSAGLTAIGMGTLISSVYLENKENHDFSHCMYSVIDKSNCYHNFDVQENTRWILANTAAWSFISVGAINIGTLIYAIVSKPDKNDSNIKISPTSKGFVLQGDF